MDIYLILISFMSLLSGFYIGRKYEKFHLAKMADKNLKKSIEKINYLTEKIKTHQESQIILSDERNLEILQHTLNEELSDEDYEAAAEIRDVINNIKNRKSQ